jgi:hypothetical protein
MLDPPPACRKTRRKRRKDNHADRRHTGFAATIVASTPPQSRSPVFHADRLPSTTKAELALWRAFLAEEIDAILRVKD